MEKTKKNNKGFSLVELIVVVLIMAIIAVSLAPQVMKWVNNSRIATDKQTIDAVVSYAQLALTNKDAYAEITASGSTGATIEITDSGFTVSGTEFEEAFLAAAGLTAEGSGIEFKTTGARVKVTVANTGAVSWAEVDSSGNVITVDANKKLTSSDLD